MPDYLSQWQSFSLLPTFSKEYKRIFSSERLSRPRVKRERRESGEMEEGEGDGREEKGDRRGERLRQYKS